MKLRWLLLGVLTTLVLVPALLLTTARLLDLPGGTWVRLVAFTPYALVLYAAALLLLLLAWWRGRGFWRGTARVLGRGVPARARAARVLGERAVRRDARRRGRGHGTGCT